MKIMACLQVALTSIILCAEPYSDWTENIIALLPEYQKSNLLSFTTYSKDQSNILCLEQSEEVA